MAHFIEERLISLKALKDQYELSAKWKEWKQKANMKEISQRQDENDMRTQVSSVVKRQKDAELSASLPEWSFIPLDDFAQANRKIIKTSWDYHWLASNTDSAIGKVISQATTYGTWILFDGIKHTHRVIKEPYISSSGSIEYKERTIQKSEIYCEKIPFLNFFINGSDINQSTEAIVVRYYNKDEYINEKTLNPLYKNIGKLKATSDYDFVDGEDGKDIKDQNSNSNTITEIEYWNAAKDEYIILANWIEIFNSPIPYKHKKLPFCLFIDNDAEDRIWWIWEFELLEQEEITKNEYRSLTVKAVKASIGFILKDAWSDLDPASMEYGIQEVYETNDIDGIQHFAPNVPIGAISELEWKIDNDIIAKSWVDFKGLLLAPSESATRTANKSLSARKRINKCIKDNAYNFYRRLWEIRMSNIQQLHTKPRRIPIEWGSINERWIFISDESGAYGSAVIWAKFTKWDFLVRPIVETMLWETDQRRKDTLASFMQLAWNILWDDGKPIIKWAQLVKLASDEYGYDYEKLTEQVEDSQSADDIVNSVFWEGASSPEDNPNYVPPAQRRQRDQVKQMSWQAKIIDDGWTGG